MLRREIVVKNKALRISHNFCCVSCIFDLNEDVGKYEMVARGGKPRVKLKAITLTLFQCPKCGRQHIDPNFKDPNFDGRQQRKNHEENVAKIREAYHPSFLGEKDAGLLYS